MHLLVAFRQELAEGGFVEGQNVVVEYPSDRGQYDLLPAMAADLVRRRVNVLTTAGGEPSALAAKGATRRLRSCSGWAAIRLASAWSRASTHPAGGP